MTLTATTPDGQEVAAYDFGGDGPALLLVHATSFHAHVFLPMVERLRTSFHCYAYDLPGHGASPPPADGDFNWRRLAASALAVSRAFGLEQPLGFGHSCGGAVLVIVEQEQPGTWSSLYLYEPVITPPMTLPPEMQGERNPLAAGALRRREVFASRAEAYDNFAGKAPFDVLDARARQAYVDYGFVDRPDGTVGLACRPADEAAYYQMAPLNGAYERLGEVSCPTVVAGGNALAHFGPAATAAIASALPAGRQELFEGLGHFGPLQDPVRVADAAAAAFRGDPPGQNGSPSLS
jgi:pimeloyl-ACP methyl ester carboxylesterase